MNYMSTTEAAQALGYHPEHVRRLIRNGDLDARKWHGIYIISPQAVDDFRQSRAHPRLLLCPECGNVVYSNWFARHLSSDCQQGHHTHEQLGLVCHATGCDRHAVYGGKSLGTAVVVCDRHADVVRDAEPLFPAAT